jgi:hypothetical protein
MRNSNLGVPKIDDGFDCLKQDNNVRRLEGNSETSTTVFVAT